MVSDRSNGIYRCVIAALIGLILIGAGEPPKTSDHTKNRQPSSEIEHPAKSITRPISQVTESTEKDGGCKKGKDERNSDLCAQWKAADAATDAAEYAWWTLCLSFFGTSLLIWTLWETRNTSRRQLRAYLMVDDVTATIDGDNFIATLRWLNCGLTPAHNVRVAVKLDLAHLANFEALPPPQDGGIHIGSGKGFKSIESLTAFEFHGHDVAIEQLWLYARVTYADIFGRSHKTDVCFEYAGGTEFKAGPCGNVAT